MPLGEGWGLNIKTGETIKIYDHFSAVKENPEKFGLKEVVGKRKQVLRQVFKNGWMRIRSHWRRVVFEFDDETINAMNFVHSFLRDHSFGPLTTIKINNLKYDKSVTCKYIEITKDL